jgi:DNA-binding NarL/FixJ family response regulator
MQNNEKARILIIDDHAVVRQGVAMLINREPDLHACCEAADINQAMGANRSCTHDLAVVDLSLAEMSGLELTKKLLVESPGIRILMMSMHDEVIYATQALRAGAHGYIMKQVAAETMLQAIRQILQGEMYVSDQMRSHMLKQATKGHTEFSPANCLTPSEFEVMHMIGLGLGTKEISSKLNRSISTIETHRTNIKNKLNFKSGNELIHFAINMVASQN